MKASEKLHKAYQAFVPHIAGHHTAMNTFLEALEEVETMESKLKSMESSEEVGDRFIVCIDANKQNNLKINQISREFKSKSDAESFKNTMQKAYRYENESLVIINIC